MANSAWKSVHKNNSSLLMSAVLTPTDYTMLLLMKIISLEEVTTHTTAWLLNLEALQNWGATHRENLEAASFIHHKEKSLTLALVEGAATVMIQEE